MLRASATAGLIIALGSLLFPTVGAQLVPKELQPPASEQMLVQVHAKGDQIYQCSAANGAQFAWTLKAPEAQLTGKDGKPFGKHFAGPTWEANDGSRVTGKAAANVPSPDPRSIPWLLVTVVSRSGDGALSRVTSIQRINTKGGNAPTSGCDAAHAGGEFRASYSADYVFFSPK
jgi:FtsP/CotA-like multicopper oxidase with cupredoxin domain